MKYVLILLLMTLPAPARSATVEHVLLVSVDGLSGSLLGNLLADDVGGEYANFQRLVDEGATTLNARTDFTFTTTLPNHTCMMTGRPVTQPAGQPVTVHHGYTSNVDPGPDDTLHNQGNPAVPYVASAFDVVHDHGRTTALYTGKSKFVLFDQSYDADHGAPDVTGLDDGPDKIDTYAYASSAANHAALLADLASSPPEFCFVHYPDPDTAGHASGWGSETWNDAVKTVDGYLGDLLDAVDANPALQGRTVIILTADHGGTGYGHSTATDWRTYTIPFMVWGAGVDPGANLYTLNLASRTDPGTVRPSYNDPAPIRNGGSGNLALSLLQLPSIPGSTINDAQDLLVASPATAVSPSQSFVQLRAFPNPFRASTELSFDLARAGNVRFSIYDTAGRLVRVLESQQMGPGRHSTFWNGRDASGRSVARGVYYGRLESGAVTETRKLIYVR